MADCWLVPDDAMPSDRTPAWRRFKDVDRDVCGDDREAMIAALQAHVDARDEEFEIEYAATLPDQTTQWRSVRGAITYDESGAPSTLEGVAFDITSRKLGEERVRKLLENVDVALGSSDTSLWEIEVDGDANPPRLTDKLWMAGRHGQLSGDRVRAVGMQVAPEHRAAMFAAVDANVRGETEEFNFEYRTLEMPARWRFGRGRTIRDASGKPRRFVGTSIDITELKRAQEEKDRATAILHLAARLSGVYVWRFDFVDGQIDNGAATYINVWESLGYGGDVPTDFARSMDMVVLPEDQPGVMLELGRTISGEKPGYEAEYRVRHADGSIHWNLGRGTVTRDANGVPQSWIGTSIDITAYKAMEEEARRYKERLELAILGSKTCTWDFEILDGTLANARANFVNVFEVLGYVRDEGVLFPPSIDSFTTPAEQVQLREGVQEALDGHDSEWERVYPVRHRDGSERIHLSRGVIRRDVNGRATRFTGISIDITERKRAEAELRESEQRFRAVFENTAVGYTITDVYGIVIDCNDMLCRFFGVERDDLIGSYGPLKLFPDQDPALPKERQRQLREGEVDKLALDLQFRREDGTYAWTNVRFSVMTRTADGAPERILGIFLDITERMNLEESLRRTREQMELGIRGSGTTIFEIEMPHAKLEKATLRLINGWEQFGYDPPPPLVEAEQVRALIVHPGDQARSKATAEAYLRGETPHFESEYRIVHGDGSISWWLTRGQAIRDASGAPKRLLGSMVNITAMKQYAVELQQARHAAELANRAKDEFLANVSHEIRTPMNAILGMTELALDAAESAHQRQLLSTVKVAARSLLHVINDLLDFSKITAGKLALDHADFSLRAAIGDTLRALAVRAHRKGLELVCHVHQEVPDIYFGDAGRVRQVLMNLIGNAIKFTGRGEVVVEVKIEPGASDEDGVVPLLFTVRDTGIGIAPHKHASIFRAFEQEDASTTRKFGGTGLGLTISSQIAQLMGGRITVESEPGTGSTFSFTARIGRSSKPEWVGMASPGPLEGLEVLVVDDNATNRLILIEWLANWRMHPTAAADAASTFEALDRAHDAATPYALVLLDSRMPDIDGIPLADQIRRRYGSEAQRMILLSSDHSPTLPKRAREAGIHAYLLKPVQQSELLETIWFVMSSSENEEAIAEPATSLANNRVRGLKVLVAEDNELNVTLLRELLAQQGHVVEVAGDGRDALALATGPGAAYDVMLLDLHMPEIDGFEVVQAIRERERDSGWHLPIIALTARSSARDREKALAAGMDEFLSKPIDVEALWAAIERVTTASPARRRELSRLLDARAIVQMSGGRRAVLDRLCEVFRSNLPVQMAATRAALDASDLGTLRVVAHKLAGTLSAFSTVAGAIASALEDAAAARNLELCATLVSRLEAVSAQLLVDTRDLTLEALGL
ncbi:MAG: PAS domain-containing protein [Kofleriaceae bacterium]